MSLLPLTLIRPEWLLFSLPPLLALWYYARLPEKSANAPAIAPHLREALTVRRAAKKWIAPLPAAMLALVLSGIALSGPSWQRQESPLRQDESVVILALDASASMHRPRQGLSHWEMSLLKSRDLIAALPPSKVGIIAYAGSAHWVLPPSRDKGLLDYTLKGLNTLRMPVEGKYWQRIEQPIEQLALQIAGVIVMSDQFISPPSATQWPVHGWLIGESNSVPADVVAMSYDEEDIDELVDRLTRDMAQVASSGEQWRDDGYVFIVPMALVVLLWFRRGWSIAWCLLLVSQVVFYSPTSQADDSASLSTWFFSGDQRGRYLFEQADFPAAAEAFEDPLWRGISHYQAGNYAAAAGYLIHIDSPYARFLLANALVKEDQLARGLAIYHALQTADASHPYGNMLAKNIALVEQRLAQRQAMAESQQTDFEEGEQFQQVAADEVTDPSQLVDSDLAEQLSGQDILAQQALADRWMAHINTAVGDYLTALFSQQSARLSNPSGGDND